MVVFCSAVLSVYMVFFHHGPAEEILANNMREDKSANKKHLSKTIVDDSPASDAMKVWENFVEKHNYVVIGEMYDDCGKISIVTWPWKRCTMIVVRFP
jgi:hypothetical protein